MTEGYLQILIESLEKKNTVLDKVIELDKQQAEISAHQPMDMKAYDKTMDEKGELIDEINRLDDGFTATYELIKDEVQAEPDKYRKQVLVLQELIRKAVDKGVTIEAQEKRNRAALENVFRMKRQEIKQMKVSSSAAATYYKSMSRINTVDPQLMDRKK